MISIYTHRRQENDQDLLKTGTTASCFRASVFWKGYAQPSTGSLSYAYEKSLRAPCGATRRLLLRLDWVMPSQLKETSACEDLLFCRDSDPLVTSWALTFTPPPLALTWPHPERMCTIAEAS